MLDFAAYTIKNGEIVVQDGLVLRETEGDVFTVSPGYDPMIEERIREFFRNYYSVNYENYPIEKLHRRKVIPCAVHATG